MTLVRNAITANFFVFDVGRQQRIKTRLYIPVNISCKKLPQNIIE